MNITQQSTLSISMILGATAIASPGSPGLGYPGSASPASKGAVHHTTGGGGGGGAAGSPYWTTELTHHRNQHTIRTELSQKEREAAEAVWQMYVRSGFVESLGELLRLLSALQVLLQPVVHQLAESAFEDCGGHFSFMDFVSVLEQCKSIHIRWVHKIQGKTLDDDLLEAFVAVGGHEDSGGEVDLRQMKSVISQFELKVDLDRIVAEMDTDGNADIDFSEFAELLRQPPPPSAPAFMEGSSYLSLSFSTATDGKSGGSGEGKGRGGGGDQEGDVMLLDEQTSAVIGDRSQMGISGPRSVVLSSMEYYPDDSDIAIERPPSRFAGVTLDSSAFGGTSRPVQRYGSRRGTLMGSRPPSSTQHRKKSLMATPPNKFGSSTANGTRSMSGGGAQQQQQPPKHHATAFYKGSGGLRPLKVTAEEQQIDDEDFDPYGSFHSKRALKRSMVAADGGGRRSRSPGRSRRQNRKSRLPPLH